MGDLTYEQKIKSVYRGLWLLAIVTLIEVGLSLLGKGHIIEGMEKNSAVIYGAAILIGVLSVYKAYFIIYEFMHLGHEVKGMRMTVLLPLVLLIWAVIAFFNEGNYWNNSRKKIKEFNEREADESSKPIGMIYYLPKDTEQLF